MTSDLQYIVRQTTDEEHANGMPYVTSSMIEAVNTCPRWGIVHNVLGKRFTTGYRQMALEAGSLMHDVFACLNLLHVGIHRSLPEHMHYHGRLLFGPQRWEFIWNEATKKDNNPTIDSKNVFERMIYACIASSEFYDDPNDKNRTLANLEHCALELLQYWMMCLVELPIYIEDENKPESRIGIELSLDAVFEHDRESDDYTPFSIRCIGLVDALYQNPETKMISLGEYKTASSMNDAWRLAFDTRHQITLYNALLQAYFGRQEEFNTILIGSAIPVRSTGSPVQHFSIARDQENVQELLRTFLFTRSMIDVFKEHPLETPMFTHSCNRYFRPCSLMDLCTATKEDQYVLLENMEVEEAASPSEQKALMRNM